MTSRDPDPPIQLVLTNAVNEETAADNVQEIGELYECVRSFIHSFGEATDNGETLPEELDADTKRKLRTVDTYLQNVEGDLLATASEIHRQQEAETDTE
jgi:hypothetical protein